MQKPRFLGGALTCLARASVSRILSWTAIYLGLASQRNSSGTSAKLSPREHGLALGQGFSRFTPPHFRTADSSLFAPLVPAKST